MKKFKFAQGKHFYFYGTDNARLRARQLYKFELLTVADRDFINEISKKIEQQKGGGKYKKYKFIYSSCNALNEEEKEKYQMNYIFDMVIQ